MRPLHFAVCLTTAMGLLSACVASAVGQALVPPRSMADEAAHFAGLSLHDYVRTLREAHSGATADDAMLLHSHIRYYTALQKRMKGEPHVVRDAEVGSAVDCVEFHLQPSLIEAPAEVVADAERLLRHRADEGWRQDTTCPSGLVAVARPVVAFRGGKSLRLVAPRRKGAPPRNEMPLVEGYSYVDSPAWSVPNTTQRTYTVLGVGQSAWARLPSSPLLDFSDHSINQGWWLDFTEGFSNAISLEAGWIDSSYFTFFPSLTLFAFSTPDGYAGGPGDNYNTQGGFIQYPGSPPVGVARLEVLFEVEYRRLPNATGFELRLRPFHLSEYGIFYEFEDWIPVGFYHMSRYPRAPSLTTFQTGQEIYQDSNSTQLTAAGKIFGYGADDFRFPVLNNFTNFGVEIGFRYGNFPVFKTGTNETGPNYVHFFGVPGANSSSSSSAWN